MPKANDNTFQFMKVSFMEYVVTDNMYDNISHRQNDIHYLAL